jgi:hypothetical protein
VGNYGAGHAACGQSPTDRTTAAPVVVSTSGAEPEQTVTDVRNFFLQMVRLRYGWTSLTVERDLDEYLRQCYGEHRRLERARLEAPVEGEGDATVPRLQSWIRAGIAQHLTLPDSLEEISCKTAEGVWHCTMNANLLAQHLVPQAGEHPIAVPMTFVGTLLPVPHTPKTPYGLVVGALMEASREVRG